MRYEDQLYSHPGYYNGALAAIKIYTRIHDHPDLTEEKLSKLYHLSPVRYALISSRGTGSRPEESCQESSKSRTKSQKGRSGRQ
jgi:hypothetical protein